MSELGDDLPITQSSYAEYVVPVLQHLWKRCEHNIETNSERLKWFRSYRVGEVLDALREHYSEKPNGWEPVWKSVRGILWAHRKKQGAEQPDVWNVSDEISLNILLTENQARFEAGRCPAALCEEKLLIEQIIGKTPSQFERQEAQKILGNQIEDANRRMRERNSPLRLTNPYLPEAETARPEAPKRGGEPTQVQTNLY